MTRRYFVILLICITVALAFLTFKFWWEVRRTPSDKSQAFHVSIKKGQSIKSLASELSEMGLIKSPFYFQLYIFISGREFAIQPGSYEMNSMMSIRDIVEIISQSSRERKITFPEGNSLKDIELKLVANGIVKKGELGNLKINDFQNLPSLFKDIPSDLNLEGYLFPDTYRFYEDSDARDVALKFLNNLTGKLPSDWLEAISKRQKSFFEILTMASLLEKETKSLDDQKIVAGILWKRLKADVPLQVDATLVFVTGRQQVYESDKKINSPYNTYLYRGLPKGPIANPGLGAIEAAIFPKENLWWYYLSTLDGQMIYSKNLEEHNAAKARYLKSFKSRD